MPEASRPRKIPARFYREDGGSEPVRVWLLELSREERRIILSASGSLGLS